MGVLFQCCTVDRAVRRRWLSLGRRGLVAEGQGDRAYASIGASWSGMQQQCNLYMGTTTMHVSAHVQLHVVAASRYNGNRIYLDVVTLHNN